MSLKTIRTIFTAAAASLLMIACSSEEPTPEPNAKAETPAEQPAQKAPESAKPVNKIVERMDPDGKGMHLTATNPAGKKFEASIGDEVDLPSEFPKDVPVFPGSTPMASMSSPDEGMIVTFKSDEEQQAIFDFYQSELANAGWEILEDPAFGNRLAFDALKDSRKVSVVVAGTKGDSRVSVIVTPNN
ncbi:MAG: hypothetical protein JRE38_00985 [Deltaproteobacteria bacterium]|nr:hypothetical protein [Deltaproteobacteria bacterium]MBW2576621.1 hypothetical protein [Deltaproteobacteria bacterium]MBW2692861.1 hypothetical protein [Deltaproteobacteria bacterium]